MNGADMNLQVPLAWWIGTLAWFSLLLFGDLYLHRSMEGRRSLKKDVARSCVWISLGLLLGAVIWWHFGHDAGTKYYAGFLIEKALSIDNIFVWGVILNYLKIPGKYRYKVLFWGIFGAIFFRTVFVFAGIAIIENFQPALILLGIALFVSALKLLRDRGGGFDPDKSKIIRFIDRILPVSSSLGGGKFIIREHGKKAVSLLLFAVFVIELTDILFAIDSVPAALAVARHPYLVLSSNIAAILGLRALYFVFDGLREKFQLLNKGLALILAYIGVTLILSPTELFGWRWFGLKVPTALNLAIIMVTLTISIAGSLLTAKSPKTD